MLKVFLWVTVVADVFILAAVIQVAEAADKIAGDSPLLWALVIGAGGLVTAVGVLWKAYRSEAKSKDEMIQRAIEAMTTMTERESARTVRDGTRDAQLDRIESKLNGNSH